MTARISMADVKFSFQCPGRMYSPAWMAPEGNSLHLGISVGSLSRSTQATALLFYCVWWTFTAVSGWRSTYWCTVDLRWSLSSLKFVSKSWLCQILWYICIAYSQSGAECYWGRKTTLQATLMAFAIMQLLMKLNAVVLFMSEYVLCDDWNGKACLKIHDEAFSTWAACLHQPCAVVWACYKAVFLCFPSQPCRRNLRRSTGALQTCGASPSCSGSW